MSRTGREKGRRHSRRLAQRRLERHDGLTRQEIVARKKVALGPGRKEREGIRLRHESVVGKRVCQPRGARSERAFSVRPKTDLLRDFREHRRQADALRAKPARTVDFGFRLVAGKITTLFGSVFVIFILSKIRVRKRASVREPLFIAIRHDDSFMNFGCRPCHFHGRIFRFTF